MAVTNTSNFAIPLFHIPWRLLRYSFLIEEEYRDRGEMG